MADYYGASDLPSMLTEFGVPVSVGSASSVGLLDQSDSGMLPAGTNSFVGKEIVLTVQTGSMAGLVSGATIIANGNTYKIIQAWQADDGAVTKIHCAR